MTITIRQSEDLSARNSLALRCRAQYYCSVQTVPDVRAALLFAVNERCKVLPLGGGSNVVLEESLQRTLVVSVDIAGISLLSESDTHVIVEVGAGVDWHSWTEHARARGWYGLENLSLIPGRVGAAPIQNIGAYGVEVSSVIESVSFVEICGENGELSGEDQFEQSLDSGQCKFSYRDSVFKSEMAGRFVITAVRFRLQKVFQPILDYQQLQEETAKIGGRIRADDVAAAVVTLRNRKLPNPADVPNAGSFFKNVEVDGATLDALLAQYPDMPSFLHGTTHRIPSAWLIESCGFKGVPQGNLQMHSEQALVLTNIGPRGSAVASEVLGYAEKIRSTVREKYGLTLEQEPVYCT